MPKAGVSEGPYTTGQDSEAAVSVPVLGRVPFPCTASGEHPSFGLGPGPASRLGALPSSLETLTQAEMSGNGIASAGLVRNQYRCRYNWGSSVLDGHILTLSMTEVSNLIAHVMRVWSILLLGVRRLCGMERLLCSFSRMGRNTTMWVLFMESIQTDVRFLTDHFSLWHIGNLLGRGQFGSVYKALNTVDGHTIAIKRISLEGHSEDEISNLMREVEVLKRLDHPGIVKYLGIQRKRDSLNIALECVRLLGLLRTFWLNHPPSIQIRRERFPGTNSKGVWKAQ